MNQNPYAPPQNEMRGYPPGQAPGGTATIVQALVLGLLIALHGLMLIGAAAQIAKGVGPAPILEDARKSGDAAHEGAVVGGLLTYFVILVWGPISMGWAVANLIGLFRKSTWVYGSLLGYWIVNLVVCLCAPFGLVGLIHLVLSRASLQPQRIS